MNTTLYVRANQTEAGLANLGHSVTGVNGTVQGNMADIGGLKNSTDRDRWGMEIGVEIDIQGESSFLPPLKSYSARSHVNWSEISLSARRYKGILYSNLLGVARRITHPVQQYDKCLIFTESAQRLF